MIIPFLREMREFVAACLRIVTNVLIVTVAADNFVKSSAYALVFDLSQFYETGTMEESCETLRGRHCRGLMGS